MTKALLISEDDLGQMIEHCASGRPNESCGILAARDGEVVRVIPMRNASQSPVRYSLDPEEQFKVYRMIDSQGWELGGVYHSHTRTEAYPSPTDVRLAMEDVPYVIVSFAQDPPSVRAFRIVKAHWSDETGEVREIALRSFPARDRPRRGHSSDRNGRYDDG